MTDIEWTHRPGTKGETWNPIVGCSIKSPGCAYCYAMRLAGTRLAHTAKYDGLTRPTKAGPVWTGEVRLWEPALDIPLSWRARRTVFVNSQGDLFHENVRGEWLDRIFAIMELCPQHTFLILTKRADRMRDYMRHARAAPVALDALAKSRCELTTIIPTRGSARAASSKGDIPHLKVWPLPNVWIGTSVERQQEADERRPDLQELARCGWTTFVSYEPALGPVDWTGWDFTRWIISGGESGAGARPSHPDWHRATREFCARHGIAYFFKQWGQHAPCEFVRVGNDGEIWRRSPDGKEFWFFDEIGKTGVETVRMSAIGKKKAGRILDGVTHSAFPQVAA